jgi:hypothetical protein
MGSRPVRGLLALVVALALFAIAPAFARADTGDIVMPQNEPPSAADGWQAGTCTEEPPESLEFCSPESETSQFYTQAAGHPPYGFTQYIIRHGEEPSPFGVLQPLEEPIAGRIIKTERVDLPPGLTTNPEATPQCSLADFERVVEVEGKLLHIPACKDSTWVGWEEVTLVVNTAGVVPSGIPGVFLPKGFVIPPDPAKGTKAKVFNLEPKEGEPAHFGFVIAFTKVIFLDTEVAWENDYHESFTIRLPEPSVPFSTLKSRLVDFGQDAGNLGVEKAGDGTFITTPTTCYSPLEWPHLYSTWFRAESHEEPNPNFPFGSTPVESKLPPGVEPTGCGKVPFDPGIEVNPGTTAVDSPSGATVDTTLKYYTGAESEIEASHLKRAEVTLPQGMALNPSGANGLVACADAQFKKGVRTYDNECPAASKIGTVEIETPPLPAGALKGDVYAGQQKSSNPASGEMFRILVEAKSKERGVDVRLVGTVKANPATGQLTAVFDEQEAGEFAGKLPQGLPQAPFTSVKIHFDGSKAVLTSPPTCSEAETAGAMEPWARPGTTAPVSSKFTLSTAPGGGTCPKALAERPFSPGFSAGPRKTKAGAYSPFDLRVTRPDGAQELKRIDVKLPPGMVAKLRGLEYCPESAIAAGANRSGTEVIGNPICPDKSFVGTVGIDAGSGPSPLHVIGNVYFAGPFKGAPVSLVFVTPAVAGPFDLGTVVVRTALYVDPETARVTAVSDPIPHVFGGVKLDIRAIHVSISRKGYTVNPTNCRRASIASDVFGGGADPADPASWIASAQSTPFRATKCGALGFRPSFHARILGGPAATRRVAHPRLRTVLEARKGDANLRRAAFVLPQATILDQGHIRTICTRVQLAAHECPQEAIYGHATATSPLLSGRLEGPVYLTSSNHELPDLLVDLRGQVNIRLRGVIGSVRGRLKTVFFPTPDVAVNKFVLTMRGGDRGLLVNSEDLCARRRHGFLNLKAQNGKRLKTNRLRLNVPACRRR